MKQKDLFWSGTVLLVLVMFIVLQTVQEPLYSGIAGGICALAAAALFWCGMKAYTKEKSEMLSKRMEEQKQLEAQNLTRSKELQSIQGSLEALTEEVRFAAESVKNENQRYLQIFEQLSKEARECSESERAEIRESAKLICGLTLEQHTALRKEVEGLAEKSSKYFGFMIEQPFEDIKSLAEALQAMSDVMDSMASAVDSIRSDTEKQLGKALDRLENNGESLQDKLQKICKTMEKQSKESIDAMDRIMKGYSGVTAQDIKVLTDLSRNLNV